MKNINGEEHYKTINAIHEIHKKETGHDVFFETDRVALVNTCGTCLCIDKTKRILDLLLYN